MTIRKNAAHVSRPGGPSIAW